MMIRTTQTICLGILLAGCWKEPCPGDLIAQGIYRLDANTDEVSGVEATLVGKGRELVLSGRLLARHHPNGPISATGEIYVVSPDGEILSRQPLVFAPNPHGRRTHPPASFAVALPEMPPVGSTVQIRFEKTPYDPNSTAPPIR